ncbi:MAG: type II toxin-antitoxin system VapC family toxin [Burkholderiales bacterium]|nr:type II toxin-antitoxin system VapC family toxin [Burkholderiales bacterium]
MLHTLRERSAQKHKIAVSAITYAEMRFGAIGEKSGKKSSPKHGLLVDAFIKRLDAVLPWDKASVDATAAIKKALAAVGTPIGTNAAAPPAHQCCVFGRRARRGRSNVLSETRRVSVVCRLTRTKKPPEKPGLFKHHTKEFS